jgi:quercetin dioxygenase-like cupin family protein
MARRSKLARKFGRTSEPCRSKSSAHHLRNPARLCETLRKRDTLVFDQRTDVVAVHFKESPPHSAFDWHEAPERQYVITLAGTLEFTTRDGEKCIIHPGEVSVATDTSGSGHKWRLVDDQPWRRCYVVLKPDAPDLFMPIKASDKI